MPIITLLRGFKVPVEVIDAFLTANGLDETAGTPPFYSTNESEDQVTVLLRKKMPNSSTTTPCRLLLPYKKGYKRSRWAYIAYTWVHVFAQLTMDLEDDLPSDCPPGFHHLKKEIFSFANGGEEPEEGFFVVVNDEGSYIPQELQDRGKQGQECNICHEIFEDWDKKEQHRNHVHGLNMESIYALPDNS